MKDIKESVAVIEHVIESKFLNLRDLNQEDAEEFNKHWEAINIVPKSFSNLGTIFIASQ